MKVASLIVALAAAAGAGNTLARANCCPGGYERVTNAASGKKAMELQSALSGRTVCAASGSDRWQEWHGPGGALWDYKRGPNDKMDPSKQVGTWAVQGSGDGTVVRYAYAGDSTPYAWSFCQNKKDSSAIALCNGTRTVTARLSNVLASGSTNPNCPP